MTTRDILIFMAVMTFVVVGITAVGFYYFNRWYMEEKKSGRRHIDAHTAEILRDRKKEPR